MTGNNVWFISGATSGFGLSIAREALFRGDKVIASSRSATTSSKLISLSSTYPSSSLLLIDLDVSAPDSTIQSAFQKATDAFGPITHFINAAGYLLQGPIEGASQQEVLNTFTVNVLGNINLIRNEIALLRPRGQEHVGVIANFGSMASWGGGPGYAYYSATKWAISGFTESLYEEVAPLGIRGIVIEPGYFRTGFLSTGGGNMLRVEKQMAEEYKTTGVGGLETMLAQANDNQPGDVAKGAKVIVDVLTQTGVGAGREIPMRLLLGPDCVEAVRSKMARTEATIKEWEHVSLGTDHEDVRKD
ncbi:uncharacterized protein BCR38DRAFT_453503 [Pseudomassariella vexata]|uniref:Uncharacterized protein n=1 Tax=Pseudomassariella vexata TaxID=1141098 RepID=A0A1Y2D7I2_9PEZI|nr:uncharacterized protein BCR38DRAFT_453503 [Pseudomassariella vexata]ORY54565.1 hypothetical protein BCR38DRAFT_453503 [Pseudomassariella vexata]